MDDREDSYMEELLKGIDDTWRLCDELSVIHAALLITGNDPSGVNSYVENWAPDRYPLGYLAAKTAIANALRRGTIDGRLTPLYNTDINGNWCGPIENSIDLSESTIEVESLKIWLAGRGMKTGFFFPQANNAPDYLDQNHLSYAPKLAAAIGAWQAVTADSTLMRGTTAKQAMMKWLRKNADRYGLTKDDGNPNEQGIEEVAKIANWDAKGGAPKTL